MLESKFQEAPLPAFPNPPPVELPKPAEPPDDEITTRVEELSTTSSNYKGRGRPKNASATYNSSEGKNNTARKVLSAVFVECFSLYSLTFVVTSLF